MATIEDMPCNELVELVTDYLEGRLPADDRSRLEQHLLGCEGCTNYLDQMRETIRLVGTLREEDVAPPVLDAVLAAFRDGRRAD